MKIMARVEYDALPEDVKKVKDGKPWALYLGVKGTTWGPVRVVEPFGSFGSVDMRDVVGADWDMLRAIGAGELSYKAFVWLDDEPDFEPLLVDVFTASAMVKVHDALNPKNQAKFEAWIAKSRGHFGTLVDFTWGHVK